MPNPVTLESLKAYCGVTGGNSDNILQELLDATIPAFADFCNRDSFFSADYTAWRDGSGSNKIVLSNYPITAVASVVVDGVSIPPSDGISSGFSFAPGGRIVFLRGYRFTMGTYNVQIHYTAGYDDPDGKFPLPEDIAIAVKMYVSARFRERDKLGIGAKTLGGESVSSSDSRLGAANTQTGGMPAAASNILENYINSVPEYDL